MIGILSIRLVDHLLSSGFIDCSYIFEVIVILWMSTGGINHEKNSMQPKA